uniref:Uncharacterized protein n=1 Tax=Nelumbo nucifera TaxID=4432 RepID=A0A822YRV5_NELNU|nr:TPA_asm: hypothetical protein HUJ06_006022 [Nelumbo nucifera]
MQAWASSPPIDINISWTSSFDGGTNRAELSSSVIIFSKRFSTPTNSANLCDWYYSSKWSTMIFAIPPWFETQSP